MKYFMNILVDKSAKSLRDVRKAAQNKLHSVLILPALESIEPDKAQNKNEPSLIHEADVLVARGLSKIGDEGLLNSKLRKVVSPNLKSLGKDALTSSVFLKQIDLRNVVSFGLNSLAGCENLEEIRNDRATELAKVISHCSSLQRVSFRAVEKVDKEFCTNSIIGCLDMGRLSAVNAEGLSSYMLKDSSFPIINAFQQQKTAGLLQDLSVRSETEQAKEFSPRAFSAYITNQAGFEPFVVGSVLKLPPMVEKIACQFRSRHIVELVASGVKQLNDATFAHNNQFVRCSFPQLTRMGQRCFAFNTSLKSFVAPKCSFVDAEAFLNCFCLSELSMPLTTIGNSAFKGCNLTRVRFPLASVVGHKAFSCCPLVQADLGDCSDVASDAFELC